MIFPANCRATRLGVACFSCMFVLWAAACTPAGNGNNNMPANDNAANMNANDNEGGFGGVVPENAVFPADYRTAYSEVRGCESTDEHGSSYTIVFASSEAAEPFTAGSFSFPQGSILVKEEYSAEGCAPSTLTGWSTRRKEAAGFDAANGDWYWQLVSADPLTGVIFDHAQAQAQCLACHGVSPCVERDFNCND